jgi:hypothetical protein
LWYSSFALVAVRSETSLSAKDEIHGEGVRQHEWQPDARHEQRDAESLGTGGGVINRKVALRGILYSVEVMEILAVID